MLTATGIWIISVSTRSLTCQCLSQRITLRRQYHINHSFSIFNHTCYHGIRRVKSNYPNTIHTIHCMGFANTVREKKPQCPLERFKIKTPYYQYMIPIITTVLSQQYYTWKDGPYIETGSFCLIGNETFTSSWSNCIPLIKACQQNALQCYRKIYCLLKLGITTKKSQRSTLPTLDKKWLMMRKAFTFHDVISY